MGDEIFKLRIFQFWLHIQIPCKKVPTQTTFTFLNLPYNQAVFAKFECVPEWIFKK